MRFKIKIDSCFSGRFLEAADPMDDRPLAKEPNLWPLEVSSTATKLGLGPSEFVTPQGARTPVHDNPFGAPEFTIQA